MRSEKEIRKQLEIIKQNKVSGGPYSELKIIALNATKQALEWMLEETEKLLTY